MRSYLVFPVLISVQGIFALAKRGPRRWGGGTLLKLVARMKKSMDRRSERDWEEKVKAREEWQRQAII